MSLLPTINLSLDKGLVLKVYFNIKKTRYFKYVVHTRWAKYYKIKSIPRCERYIDVLLQKPIHLDNNIDTFECLYAPVGFNYRLFLNSEKTILDIPGILNQTIDKLIIEKHFFSNYKKRQFMSFKKQKLSDLKDSYFLRYYPNIPRLETKKQILEKIFDDICMKYFIIDTDIVENRQLLPACIHMGLDDAYINFKDRVLIDCCRRKWFCIIEEEKAKLIFNLKKQIDLVKKKNIKEKDKAIKQLRRYISLLNKITPMSLNAYTDIKSIISYWPDIMQPRPYFVYEY